MRCYRTIITNCLRQKQHVAVFILLCLALVYITVKYTAVLTRSPVSPVLYHGRGKFMELMGLSHVGYNGKDWQHSRSGYNAGPNEVIENKTCQPRSLSFLPGKPRYLTALFSFPGSGNTWTRHLIQELTGFYTGSVYNDASLAKNGFPGEMEPVTKISTRHCIVYKSHMATNKSLKPFNKAVIIIRNPLHAIKSYFNYEFSGKKVPNERKDRNLTKTKNGKRTLWKSNVVLHNLTSQDKHVNHADTSLFHTEKWRSFASERIKRWRMKNIQWMTKFHHNCTIVLYESLKTNCSSELYRIGKFLGINVKPKDLWCTVMNQEGHFHRKTINETISNVASLYTSVQRDEIHKSICDVTNVARKLAIELNISQYLTNLSEKNQLDCSH
ncbi:sialate:O-sulfotransferase 2-like [Argopecten irradians]|uniref:sialate:O-sulfotransferase 2-like n=1 Tax=Argopecten irradians TaxID=31199 RepID=UPI003723F04F